MTSTTKAAFTTLLVVLIAAVAGAILFVFSGAYGIGADDPHSRPVQMLLETLRERSVDSRAAKVKVPDLGDSMRVVQGAGNYEAMCVGCHLAPGLKETELSRGLYPTPPDLTKSDVGPAEAFWVIKHGIKASGMPAWGKSMDDDDVWNLAAFLQELPKLDEGRYREMVASSGGHSHGGGAHGGGEGEMGHAEHGAEARGHPHGDAASEPGGAKVHAEPGSGDGHGHGSASAAHGHGDAVPASASAPASAPASASAPPSPASTSARPAAKRAPAKHVDDGHKH